MAGTKQHQHTAPKTYLRGFANDDLKVTMRRRTGDEREVHISKVTVRKGFYNAQDATGVVHDKVENWFAHDIEDPAGPVLARLREAATSRVPAADGEVVAEFVAAQLYRTATVRSYMEQVDEHLGPLLGLVEVAKSHGVSVPDLPPADRVRHLATAGRILDEYRNADETRVSQLRTMLREIDKMTTRLKTFHWRVTEADEACLVTGDAPAVSIQPHRGGFSGVLPAGSPVYLPLTPRRLLIGRQVAVRAAPHLKGWLARKVNSRIAEESDDVLVKALGQTWPSGAQFSAGRPQLPTPTITTGRPAPGSRGPSTVPVRHHEVASPSIRNLLAELGAQEGVY